MTFLFHSVIFRIITIHMLNTGKILPENILTFTQDARKEKINCSSDTQVTAFAWNLHILVSSLNQESQQYFFRIASIPWPLASNPHCSIITKTKYNFCKKCREPPPQHGVSVSIISQLLLDARLICVTLCRLLKKEQKERIHKLNLYPSALYWSMGCISMYTLYVMCPRVGKN